MSIQLAQDNDQLTLVPPVIKENLVDMNGRWVVIKNDLVTGKAIFVDRGPVELVKTNLVIEAQAYIVESEEEPDNSLEILGQVEIDPNDGPMEMIAHAPVNPEDHISVNVNNAAITGMEEVMQGNTQLSTTAADSALLASQYAAKSVVQNQNTGTNNVSYLPNPGAPLSEELSDQLKSFATPIEQLAVVGQSDAQSDDEEQLAEFEIGRLVRSTVEILNDQKAFARSLADEEAKQTKVATAYEPPVRPKPIPDLSVLAKLNDNRQGSLSAIKKNKQPNPQGDQTNNENKLQKKTKQPKPVVAKTAVLLQSEASRLLLQNAMATSEPGDVDGRDHLNCSVSGKTKLGKMLDINAKVPFVHPDLGPFDCVGGFGFYVGGVTRNEGFRTVSGNRCRFMGREVEQRVVQGYLTIIATATWIKVNSDPWLSKALRDCDLILDCYYTRDQNGLEIRQDSKLKGWYLQVLHEIRMTLRVMEEEKTPYLPDFSFLNGN